MASTLPLCYGSWFRKDYKHEDNTKVEFVQPAESWSKKEGVLQMKKNKLRKLFVCIVVVILILGVSATAFADYYNYYGYFRYGYNTGSYTRVNDYNLRNIMTTLTGITWVRHFFTRDGSLASGYDEYGHVMTSMEPGDYISLYNLPTPANYEQCNSRFDNIVAAGTQAYNDGEFHIWGYTLTCPLFSHIQNVRNHMKSSVHIHWASYYSMTYAV